jgi:hypothetical protein
MLSRILSLPPVPFLLKLCFRMEAAWFGLSRRVHTRGQLTLDRLSLVAGKRDGHMYEPVRPSTARRVLRRLPIRDFTTYTFVDIGSGMGRMLLIASEFAFREIQGVEFAVELHRLAEHNISRCRNARRKCRKVRSLLLDAADYTFPPGNLVLYFFNPFGHEVMEEVLQRLDASLKDEPRQAIVVMVYPDFAFLLDQRPHFHLYRETRRCRTYRFCPEVGNTL